MQSNLYVGFDSIYIFIYASVSVCILICISSSMHTCTPIHMYMFMAPVQRTTSSERTLSKRLAKGPTERTTKAPSAGQGGKGTPSNSRRLRVTPGGASSPGEAPGSSGKQRGAKLQEGRGRLSKGCIQRVGPQAPAPPPLCRQPCRRTSEKRIVHTYAHICRYVVAPMPTCMIKYVCVYV